MYRDIEEYIFPQLFVLAFFSVLIFVPLRFVILPRTLKKWTILNQSKRIVLILAVFGLLASGMVWMVCIHILTLSVASHTVGDHIWGLSELGMFVTLEWIIYLPTEILLNLTRKTTKS